jgi:hypothetical protein
VLELLIHYNSRFHKLLRAIYKAFGKVRRHIGENNNPNTG